MIAMLITSAIMAVPDGVFDLAAVMNTDVLQSDVIKRSQSIDRFPDLPFPAPIRPDGHHHLPARHQAIPSARWFNLVRWGSGRCRQGAIRRLIVCGASRGSRHEEERRAPLGGSG